MHVAEEMIPMLIEIDEYSSLRLEDSDSARAVFAAESQSDLKRRGFFLTFVDNILVVKLAHIRGKIGGDRHVFKW